MVLSSVGCERYPVWKIQVLNWPNNIVILIRDSMILVSALFHLILVGVLFVSSLHEVHEWWFLVLLFKYLTTFFLLWSGIASILSAVSSFFLVLPALLDSILIRMASFVVGIVWIVTFRLPLMILIFSRFSLFLTSLLPRRFFTFVGFLGSARSHNSVEKLNILF